MHLKRGCLITFVILLLLGTALAVLGFLLPYYSAQSSMPLSGQLLLRQQPEGRWMLSWPEADGANQYRVEILQGDSGATEGSNLLYREFTGEETSLLLPELPAGEILTLRVSCAAAYQTILGEKNRYGETCLEATTRFTVPEITTLDCSVNADDKTVRVDVQRSEGSLWQYRLLDEAGNLLGEQILSEAFLVLQFGEDAPCKIPEVGTAYHLKVQACLEEPGLLIYGAAVEEIAITGESLQVRALNPVLTEEQKNTLTITWDETSGAYYEVQLLDQTANTWNTVCRVSALEARTYTTLLEPGNTYQYRIAAADEQGKYLVVSEPMAAVGKERTKYATVWPVRDLAAYSTSNMGQIIDTARVGTAYCVLEEANGMFGVRINGQICYIDSNYCMINLPEYIGGLCSYNITNSVYSIYAIHEFAIPNVTGVVTAGYEDICQDDGSYLVPLLYPTAKKLLNAAKAAQEQGYRLKIYDSFRPYKATREIYDLTSLILDTPLPDATYTGTPKASLMLPEPREGADVLTYGWLMTGRYYLLNSFLAQNGSTHNLGIAMDLTLEDLQTGEQLLMQTSMHDLSQYSVLNENNEAADLLSEIMINAGFGGLLSEWWHFQDDRSRSELGLPSMTDGVNAECWMKDDTGWKYRKAKGSYYTGETVIISGTEYAFDDNGYVID